MDVGMRERGYPYIPNSVPEVKRAMLREVGVEDESELYEEVPERLRLPGALKLPEPIEDEHAIRRHVERILARNRNCRDAVSFLGAGCAQHFVPAVVDEVVGRGEFLTCYGAETWADHGKHQAFFEYQSMIAELVDQDFLTVPTYDGPNAMAAAIGIANRLTGRRRILLPASLSPEALSVIRLFAASNQRQEELDVILVAFDRATGLLDLDDLRRKLSPDVAAVLIENPTFLGGIETGALEIGRLAKAAGAEFIVHVDPISLGVLEAPANYGARMTTGDLHDLGLHLSAGSGQGGFVTTPDEERYLWETRELVSSLTATTVPDEMGFGLCMIERTHYAQREKGKEFTGTGVNLWAIASGAYLALMGPQGMREVGEAIMQNAQYAARRLAAIPGVRLGLAGPFFKEFVLNYDGTGWSAAEVQAALLEHGIFAGLDLTRDFPELGQSALYCVTEVHEKADIDALVAALRGILEGPRPEIDR